ncbi:unnamed protein product, partial [Iphiclides podalirius]
MRNNHAPETSHLFNVGSDGITTTEERTHSGIKKPIIIKKKVGYRVYRDSDEEQAQADPKEKCRKQVKVKLCEDESESNSQKQEQDLSFDSKPGHMSEKEMKQSIQLAKEAVEHLQRDLQIVGSGSANQEQRLTTNSDSELHKDIEVARQVLEHIHSNFGNLQSMRLHAATLNNEDLNNIEFERKRMAQWKEITGQENVNTLRNIEDRFKTNNHNSEDIEVEKMFDKVIEKDDSKTNSAKVAIENDSSLSDDKNFKGNFENKKLKNVDIPANTDLETSMAQDIQSKMKLHSDNLTIQPVAVTSPIEEKSNQDSLDRNTNQKETTNVELNEKEISNRDSIAMKEADNILNQFRKNKDSDGQKEIETRISNTVNILNESKNDQMTRSDSIEDPNKTTRKSDENIQLQHEDRSFDGSTMHEDMNKQRFSEPLNKNIASEDFEQNTLNTFNDFPDHRRTHETGKHQMNGLLNIARAHDKSTDMVIPSMQKQDIKQDVLRLGFNSRNNMAIDKESSALDLSSHKTDDQSHAASEKMNMRWVHETNDQNFQTMRKDDSAKHALSVKAPFQEQFNEQSLRNSHSNHRSINGAATDTEHQEHQVPNDRLAHAFDKEPRLRAEEMKADSNTHSHHVSRQNVHPSSDMAPRHGTFHQTSHADNAVQSSNHMDTMHRSASEYAQQWFDSRGLSRGSSYMRQQPNMPLASNGGSGAVGLFPNANTGGCAIPLLLSCSPSVVSGTLAKSHPSYSAPSYRSIDDYRYHKKRETNKTDEKLAMKPDHLTMLAATVKPTMKAMKNSLH